MGCRCLAQGPLPAADQSNLSSDPSSMGRLTFRLRIFHEDLQAVDEVRARKWIATNADHKRLAEAHLGCLVDCFVGKSTGPGYDANTTLLVDEAGHDTDLADAGANEARAVGTNEASLVLGLEHVCSGQRCTAIAVEFGAQVGSVRCGRRFREDFLLVTRTVTMVNFWYMHVTETSWAYPCRAAEYPQ